MGKKILFLSLFVTILQVVGMAQDLHHIVPDDYHAFDESVLVVTYEVTYVGNPSEVKTKSKDRIVLEIGKNLSRCYNMKMYENDSITAAWMATGREGGPTLESGPFNADIYKNARSGEVSVVQRTPEHGPILKYTDVPMEATGWAMHEETKQILSYVCKKATCTFRGRTWTVWYSMKIPVPDGPWKLCGLPGLIMQADDNKGHFSFSCVGIENVKRPIKKLDKMYYQKSSRDEAVQLIRLYYVDLFGYLAMIFPEASMHVKTAKGQSVKLDEIDKITTPYNPIELE